MPNRPTEAGVNAWLDANAQRRTAALYPTITENKFVCQCFPGLASAKRSLSARSTDVAVLGRHQKKIPEVGGLIISAKYSQESLAKPPCAIESLFHVEY